MGMGHSFSVGDEKPIYEAMYEKGIIQKKMFNICMGKNGGYF